MRKLSKKVEGYESFEDILESLNILLEVRYESGLAKYEKCRPSRRFRIPEFRTRYGQALLAWGGDCIAVITGETDPTFPAEQFSRSTSASGLHSIFRPE